MGVEGSAPGVYPSDGVIPTTNTRGITGVSSVHDTTSTRGTIGYINSIRMLIVSVIPRVLVVSPILYGRDMMIK